MRSKAAVQFDSDADSGAHLAAKWKRNSKRFHKVPQASFEIPELLQKMFFGKIRAQVRGPLEI